jgi:NAD(P)H-dependent FMN reductase
MKILAFGASNSRHSINKKFAAWGAAQIKGATVELIDLNDFEMPIYSIDRERESGIPDAALSFKELVRSADGIVISFAEHNGSYTAAYKNVTDWMSRIEKPMWNDKPVFLLSTSPGRRGGIGVLDHAVGSFPHRSARLIESFSFPFFEKNFDDKNGIIDEDLCQCFMVKLEHFEAELEKIYAAS